MTGCLCDCYLFQQKYFKSQKKSTPKRCFSFYSKMVKCIKNLLTFIM
nr:MAG TPA: hypothetical protein [Caudoviricetes sp.]